MNKSNPYSQFQPNNDPFIHFASAENFHNNQLLSNHSSTFPPAKLGQCFAAGLIDASIYIFVIWPSLFIIIGIIDSIVGHLEGAEDGGDLFSQLGFTVNVAIVVIIYFLCSTFYLASQVKNKGTLGSRILNIRYIDKEGKKPNWKHGLLWSSLRFIGFFSFLLLTPTTNSTFFFLILLVVITPLLPILSFAFDPKHQSLYDKIAGLYPIDIRVKQSFPSYVQYQFTPHAAYVPPGTFVAPTTANQANAPIEYMTKVGLTIRLAALSADIFIGFILYPSTFIGLFFFLSIVLGGIYALSNNSLDMTYFEGLDGLQHIMQLALIAIPIYFWISVAMGRTVGNIVTRTRYVNSDGEKPGFKKSFIHTIFKFTSVCLVLGSCWLASYFQDLYNSVQQNLNNSVQQNLPETICLWLSLAATIWLIVAYSRAVFSKTKQTWFDKVAGIYLVK